MSNPNLSDTMQMIVTSLEAAGLDTESQVIDQYGSYNPSSEDTPCAVLIIPDVHCARQLLARLRRSSHLLNPEA